MSGKIEDMQPHYKTVLQALRYGLEILENKELADNVKVSRAKHQMKDAMKLLGYTEDLVRTYKKPKVVRVVSEKKSEKPKNTISRM